jgi:hypothetical protein
MTAGFERMTEFMDEAGRRWEAGTRERKGLDFKGRFYFVARPVDGGGEEQEVELVDVRWNSEETARRTLQTMSGVELRRRLRSARGRETSPSG